MLNPAQLNILRADILTHAELDAARLSGDTIAIAAYYNTTTVPDYIVWKNTTPVAEIQDAIIWSNYTPANPSAGAGQDFANYALACQGKQFNLQILLGTAGFSSNISTGKAAIRSGLQDCTSNIPSGVSGATVSGGWANIKTAIQRKATVLEKLFATGAGTTANPSTLGIDGKIAYSEISEAI